MVTLGAIIVLSIVWGMYFMIQYYRKQKVIANILDSNDIKPSQLITKDCLDLIEDMKTGKKRRYYENHVIFTKDNESVFLGNKISETIKNSNGLRFSPNILEWELIWRLAKKLVGK